MSAIQSRKKHSCTDARSAAACWRKSDLNIEPKIAGACSCCDEMVFDVTARHEDGRPARLGAPHPAARRIAFLLASGEIMDLTFCAGCAATVGDRYGPLWDKVLVSWTAELGDRTPPWFLEQMENVILDEIGVQDLTGLPAEASR